MKVKRIVGIAILVIVTIVLIGGNASAGKGVSGGNWFNPFLTDPGLKEFNVTISSDIDRYNFAKIWMELNQSEKRPMRFLLPPLATHYGDGYLGKMERKIQWLMNNSSPEQKKEFERKKSGYRLYLAKKYNLTLRFAANST